jgi:hypothetical protein
MRSRITSLAAGTTYALRLGYDAVEKGLHAYDYLGSVDGGESAPGQPVVPCSGVGDTAGPHACGNGPSTFAVPVDTHTTFPSGSGQKPGEFSTWGERRSSAPPPSTRRRSPRAAAGRSSARSTSSSGPRGPPSCWRGARTSPARSTGSPAGPSSARRAHPRSTCGCCASRRTRPTARSAARATRRSPYSDGARAGAVAVRDPGRPVAGRGGLRGRRHGDAGQHPGRIRIGRGALLRLQPRRPRRMHLQRSRNGPGQLVADPPGGTNGVASIQFIPDAPGSYCFRAEFVPSATAIYSPASHTNLTTECFEAVITPPQLTVTRICVPPTDGGRFNLLLNAAAVLANAACGDSVGSPPRRPGRTPSARPPAPVPTSPTTPPRSAATAL